MNKDIEILVIGLMMIVIPTFSIKWDLTNIRLLVRKKKILNKFSPILWPFNGWLNIPWENEDVNGKKYLDYSGFYDIPSNQLYFYLFVYILILIVNLILFLLGLGITIAYIFNFFI